MRPVRVEIEGFAAFRDRIEIDFDDVELFALVGPTGAGKSTVIDAICFALYGSVPRYGDERKVAPAISIGGLQAKVSLTFDLAGRRYVATRVARRTKAGGASTKEARLERGDEVLAGDARGMNDTVEALLGMSFDHFTRSVVLPQGDFARFLHDEPNRRQDLLVRLLGLDVYARMASRARQRAAEAETKAEFAQRRLAELTGATAEARATAARRATALAALKDRITAARAPVAELDERLAAARRDAEHTRTLLAALQHVVVPLEVADAARRLAEARAALRAAEDDLAALPEPGPLNQALDAHRRLHARRVAIGEAEAAVEKATEAAEEADRLLAAATEALDHAHTAVRAAERAHAVHALAAGLVPGEPCPVCEQVVESAPARSAPPEVAELEAALEAATARHAKASERQRRAHRSLAEVETTLANHRQEREELERQVADNPDPAPLEQQVAAVVAATGKRDAARTQTNQLEKLIRSASTAFDAQRDPLVTLDPPGRTGDLGADWCALEEWAAAQGPGREEQLAAGEAELDKVREERGELLRALADAAADHGITPARSDGPAIDRLFDAVAHGEAGARAEVERIERDLAEADSLAAELRTVRRDGEVARTLGEHLSAKGFERWLVEEALQVLVEDASATLRTLSGEQYSLTVNDKGEFLVVDHRNADELRPAKTLSGGETFQASLALALALADQLADLAADGAARLDAIFLDEGFGTLDEETLDTVAATIEALGAGERMVGIITHVRALADRMPVRFQVTKGATTSTVEKVVA